MTALAFSPIQLIDDPLLSRLGVQLTVLRLDLFSSTLSGNKYFKLKHNIEVAKAQGFKTLLSFGGAYSNHIHALAMAGRHYGLATIGIIRGERHSPLNPTLQDAVDAGMQLHYISRQDYRRKSEPDFSLSLPVELQQQFEQAYVIPEGGSNMLGVQGCMEIVDHVKHHLNDDFDTIVLPCGTAATMAGVAAAAGYNKQVMGVAVLKNAHYLETDCAAFIAQVLAHKSPAFGVGFGLAAAGQTEEGSPKKNWQMLHDYHHGGYAKTSPDLMAFIDRFQHQHGIPLEPVYSGKMFYGLFDWLSQQSPNEIAGLRMVAIHTGGLQGVRGFENLNNAVKM